MWKNTVHPKQATDENTDIGRTRIARWIIKATDTQSEYVIIFTLPGQQ